VRILILQFELSQVRLDAEGAWRTVDAGADAIVVSNHGGRQLDGAPSSIRMQPTIAKAVKGQPEV